MKITAFEQGGEKYIGAIDPEGSIQVLSEIGQFWREPEKTLNSTAQKDRRTAKLGNVKEIPALPDYAKVICVGLNYRLHAKEANLPVPSTPVIFSRWASTLAADGQPAPLIEEKFDWEGELGVVIGRPLFRVSAERATSGIFGYVAFNDLSARSFQMQTSQWTMGKNSPASGPMSSITTRDEVGDLTRGLRLTTKVNDKIMQDSLTSDMIFTVPQVIAHVSQVIQLEPGDLIITGTPSGIGHATGHYLRVGDRVEVEIERVGRVRTPIVAPPDPVI